MTRNIFLSSFLLISMPVFALDLEGVDIDTGLKRIQEYVSSRERCRFLSREDFLLCRNQSVFIDLCIDANAKTVKLLQQFMVSERASHEPIFNYYLLLQAQLEQLRVRTYERQIKRERILEQRAESRAQSKALTMRKKKAVSFNPQNLIYARQSSKN